LYRAYDALNVIELKVAPELVADVDTESELRHLADIDPGER